MKSLKTDLSLLSPALLEKGEKGISAWFTLKNAEWQKADRNIQGLNLGYNTSEDRQVVAKNRLALLSQLSLDEDWVAFADQVHSTRIQIVTQGGTYPSTDGLITQIPGLALAIQVADCAAVLLWDAHNKVIGALHAGWRGAAGGIVEQGIKKMKELGADPAQMKAYVSPCISLKHFEVGQEVAVQFPDKFVNYEQYEKPHVDLKGFLRWQLEQNGLPGSHIEISRRCTIEDENHLYSYRREADQSGRMMGIIQINE